LVLGSREMAKDVKDCANALMKVVLLKTGNETVGKSVTREGK
jgi:hypothetical protein